MPYLSQERRKQLMLNSELPNSPGDLNYRLTMEVLRFLGDAPNYERFNAVVGALECCKLELYRKMVAPYEDTKIEANGDVYPPVEVAHPSNCACARCAASLPMVARVAQPSTKSPYKPRRTPRPSEFGSFR